MNDQENKENIEKQIFEIENMAKKYLSQEALSRFGNLKTVHPEKAFQSAVVINQLVKEGYVKNIISDSQFKDLLLKLEKDDRQSSFRVVRK